MYVCMIIDDSHRPLDYQTQATSVKLVSCSVRTVNKVFVVLVQ